MSLLHQIKQDPPVLDGTFDETLDLIGLIRLEKGRVNLFTTTFNLDKLKGFHLNLVTTKGYSFFMGTKFVIQKMKFEINEIPIIFKDREKGISKIPKIEIFRTLTNLIILTFKI